MIVYQCLVLKKTGNQNEEKQNDQRRKIKKNAGQFEGDWALYIREQHQRTSQPPETYQPGQEDNSPKREIRGRQLLHDACQSSAQHASVYIRDQTRGEKRKLDDSYFCIFNYKILRTFKIFKPFKDFLAISLY